MKPNQSKRISARFAELILAIDGAQSAWIEYAGPCETDCCEQYCFNAKLSTVRESCLSVLEMCQESQDGSTNHGRCCEVWMT